MPAAKSVALVFIALPAPDAAAQDEPAEATQVGHARNARGHSVGDGSGHCIGPAIADYDCVSDWSTAVDGCNAIRLGYREIGLRYIRARQVASR